MIITPEKEQYILKFRYDLLLIEKVKQIPGRCWVPSKRHWTVPRTWVSEAFLRHLFNAGIAKQPSILDCAAPGTWQRNWPVPMFEHQHQMETAIVVASTFGRSLGLYGETGTGKTRAVCAAIFAYVTPSTYAKTLIVCPAPLVGVWEEELARWKFRFNIVHGKGRSVTGTYDLTTHDTLPIDVAHGDYDDISYDFAFYDESQSLKSSSTKRNKAFRKIKARTKVLMTGTPTGNDEMDVCGSWVAADRSLFGLKSHYEEAFCVFDPESPFPSIIGHKNMDLFSEILRRNSIAIRKVDCLDLPPKIYSTINLKMNPEQRKAYKRANDGAVGDQPLANRMVEIAKMRQISSGFVYMPGREQVCDDGDLIRENVQKFGTEKFNYLESIGWTEPTVIWFNFRQERDDILKALGRLGVTYLVADGDHAARYAVPVFQAEGGPLVLVCQLQSVQYGFTLTRASRVIYYSPTFSLLQRQQSEDRCHRIGTIHSVHYISLISSTVEQWAMEAVARKTDVQEYIWAKLKK